MLEIVSGAIGGAKLAQTVEGLARYPVNLRYPREIRDSVDELRNLPVLTPSGQQITLGTVAQVRVTDGPPMLKSDQGRPTSYVMRLSALVTLLALPLSLSACDNGEEVTNTQDMPMAESMPAEGMPMSEDMPIMGADTEMRMASAEGTVTAIDDEAGTITVDHGPVPAVDWPAMTMAFDADTHLRQEVAVGDGVIFDFRMSDSGNEITSISRK